MKAQMHQVRTPHGNLVGVGIREDTSDGSHAMGIIVQDEYRLKDISHLSGWALDIGSYAGHVALALAADHPDLTVIAVDPVPENIALLQTAIDAQPGMVGRVVPIQAAACDIPVGTVSIRYGYEGAIDHGNGHTTDADYVHQNRFMAGLWRQQDVPGIDLVVPTVSLRGLATLYQVERFAFCKIDCEGCEYKFLADGAELINLIVGEYHDGGPGRIVALLEPTHEVEILEDHGGTGLFRAWAK